MQKPLHQDERETLLKGLEGISSFSLSIDEFKNLITKLPKEHNSKSFDTDSSSFKGDISHGFPKTNELFDLYAHVSALERTLRWSLLELVKKEKIDEDSKQQLTREYERVFFPKYQEYFDEYGLDTLSMATLTWSMPFPSATSAFTGIDTARDFFERKRKP